MTMKKMIVSKKLIVMVIFSLLCVVSCSKPEPDTKENVAEQSQERLEPQFDVPALLQMNAEQIKQVLGAPKSEFKPTTEQLSIYPEIKSTLEYQKGTTTIQIDYSGNGKVEEIFISDAKEGRAAQKIYSLGNLDPNSNEYKTTIQNWLNPALARRNRAAEIAGIRVVR